VSLKVLGCYINAMGGPLRFSLLMSWFVVVEVARVAATVWLSYWTDSVDAPGGAPHGALWYLMIYTIISGVQVGEHLLGVGTGMMARKGYARDDQEMAS
jgi:hypothetical protein